MLKGFNLAGRVRDRSLRRASLLVLVAATVVFSIQGGQLLSSQLAENFGSPRVAMAPSTAPEPAQPASYLTPPNTAQTGVAALQPDGIKVTGTGRQATARIAGVGPLRGPRGRLIAGLVILQALHTHRGN